MSSYATGGAETQVNTYTTSYQQTPSLTALADGGWLVTWASAGQDTPDNSGIIQQRYDAFGNAVGGEILVNSYTNSFQGDPSATGLADGGWVVTWNGFGQDSDGYGVYQQRFDAGGSAVGEETLVNTYQTSFQFNQSVTALTDGGWVVTWQSDGADGSGYGIYQQRYDGDGNTVGGEIHVSTATASSQLNPAVTALSDGGWLVTWDSYGQDTADSTGIFQQRYDASGNTFGGENQVNTFTPNAQYLSAVAALADGGWVVAYESYGPTPGAGYVVYQQRYSADGAKDGAEARVTTTSTDDYQPVVTGLADGGWLVTWAALGGGQDGDGYGIYQQRYDASGHSVGGQTLVNIYTTSYQETPSVTALPDGGWITSWQSFGQDGDNWGIYQRHFAPDVLGTNAADSLVGSHWDETLIGYAGNDALDGGTGNDVLIGGFGNDTFTVNSAGDDVQELTNQGTDTVNASVTYSVAKDAVEILTLTGTGNISGTGNALANTITGNSGANTLNGGGGNDAIDGGTGNDTLTGGAGNDILTGGLGNDKLNGQSGVNTASYAAAGAAVTVSLATTAAQATGGAGSDTISFVQNLVGSAFNDTLTGSSAANVIEGGAGNDAINGGAGADTASYASAASAVTVSLAIVGAQNTVGAGSDTLTAIENLLGSARNDTLTGSTAANVIDGGAGNDVINGGSGSDTASYASATAGVAVNLALAGAQNTLGAGSDTLTSMESLTGSAYADTLTGSAVANGLNGGLGNDVLNGAGGNDKLTGGGGTDQLTGGTGADTFIFGNGDIGHSQATADTIYDFLTSQADKIDVHLLDAQSAAVGDQAFSFIGTAAFSHTAGELRYDQGAADTWIYGDTNGDGQSDFVVHLVGALSLAASDFTL
jgi:Ca2+-binding RTX toxin-like protein